jgi:hypothetical protein
MGAGVFLRGELLIKEGAKLGDRGTLGGRISQGILGEGIGSEVVEFNLWAGGSDPKGLGGAELALALEGAEEGHAGVLILLVARPVQPGLLRVKVTD